LGKQAGLCEFILHVRLLGPSAGAEEWVIERKKKNIPERQPGNGKRNGKAALSGTVRFSDIGG